MYDETVGEFWTRESPVSERTRASEVEAKSPGQVGSNGGVVYDEAVGEVWSRESLVSKRTRASEVEATSPG